MCDRYFTEMNDALHNTFKSVTLTGDEVMVDQDDVILIDDLSTNVPMAVSEKRQYLAGTKVRTLRDIRIFKEWLASQHISPDFESVDNNTLDRNLLKFYQGVRSKDGRPYTRSTLVGMRASVCRYISNVRPQSVMGSSVLKTEAFLISNAFLDQMAAREKGKGRNTIKHLITDEDVLKLMGSGVISSSNPLSIVRKVWFDLTLHFGIKGKEAIRTLKKDSFLFEADENNCRYYCLNRDKEMSKIEQFSEMHDWHWYARMYEVPNSDHCPVRSMSLYISKLGVGDDFFQRPVESKLCNQCYWYLNPMGHNTILRMMAEISEDASLSKTYTNICLKATIAKHIETHGLDIYKAMNVHPQFRSGYSSEEKRQASFQLHDLFYQYCDARHIQN